MKTKLGTLALALILVLGATVVSLAAPEEMEEKQKIVVHLSHFDDNLHAASMALMLSNALQTHGAEVTLFLDVKGVHLADARVEEPVTAPGHETSIDELYEGFVKAGGQVLLCPACAKVAGLDAGSLRPGAVLEDDPADNIRLFLDADKVIDY